MITFTFDGQWMKLQLLRMLQMLICAGLMGAGLSGLLAQREDRGAGITVGERLAVHDVVIESNRKAVENLAPRVEHLENELGKLYGIGLAVGAVLGVVNGGQVIIAAKTIRASKSASPPG